MVPESDREPATKADLKDLAKATKDDIRRLAESIVATQARVESIERRMATRDDISRVLGAIDAFARKAEAYDRKALSHGDILENHIALLREHGRRISSIEDWRAGFRTP